MKKKLAKLALKKVTLRDLDLDSIAGGTTGQTCNYPQTCTCPSNGGRTCGAGCTNTQKCTVPDTVCAPTCRGTQCI